MDSPRVTDELYCQFDGCVNTLTYAGRGRKPKYCDEHKKNSNPRTASPSGDKSLDARLRRVAAGLEENIQLVGALITPILPVTGHVVLRDSDRVANETVKLARKNPKMIAALEKANTIGPGVFLGRFVLTVGIAVAVDRETIEHDQRIALLLGVTAVYEKLHGTETERVVIVPAPTVPTL